MKSLILILSLSTFPIYANTPRENAQIRIEMFLAGKIDSINEEDLQYATEEQLEKIAEIID